MINPVQKIDSCEDLQIDLSNSSYYSQYAVLLFYHSQPSICRLVKEMEQEIHPILDKSSYRYLAII